MTDIIELAERLGKAIGNSSQASTLRGAREEMNKQGEIAQLLKDYQAQAGKIAESEHENKPVEVDDKHKLQELHGKLVASDVFKKFTAAQVEYIDLMRQVNETLQKQLSETEKA
ncbi:MAG: YlbF family regulator [Phycisphaerae bacterium]|nr:YlbF family regulator [Phycisphaerae bacterium]